MNDKNETDIEQFAEFLRNHREASQISEGVSGVTVNFAVGYVGTDVFEKAEECGLRPSEVDTRSGGARIAFVPIGDSA